MTVVQPSSSSLLSPQFLKADGSTWRKSHQLRPMVEACRRAKIDPPINFHALHHTWTSLASINGVLLIVAKTLGHTDTRMVGNHNGHLAPSYSQRPSVPARRDLGRLSCC
jgi:integrase